MEDQQTAHPQATLLFVDDEPNILSSLRRLFRPLGYKVLTAESGARGLEMLAAEAVDLVVSDMRMPEMNGAEFLSRVRVASPDTVRILLTGYAEIEATIRAINEGQIYRYISKPWEESDIILAVRHALERKFLEQEKARLEALTRQQNAELKELNASLEDKVRQRTEELRKTMELLESAHERLKKSFITSIRVFSNLLELREGNSGGHARRVGDLSLKLAQNLGMGGREAQEVMLAGLLHDIGKIGLPDRLLNQSADNLVGDDRREVMRHPVIGQSALMALEQLKDVGKLIRHHHERWDGKGYPDGLAGEQIVLGSRIIAVATDFDDLQQEVVSGKPRSKEDALRQMQSGSGSRYDPQVINALIQHLMGEVELMPADAEVQTYPAGLKPGMVLMRDVVSKDGLLLLAKGYILDDVIIEQLRFYERNDGNPIIVYVNPRSPDEPHPAAG